MYDALLYVDKVLIVSHYQEILDSFVKLRGCFCRPTYEIYQFRNECSDFERFLYLNGVTIDFLASKALVFNHHAHFFPLILNFLKRVK